MKCNSSEDLNFRQFFILSLGRAHLTLRTYILKRVALSIFILWLVATINFVVFSFRAEEPLPYLFQWQMDPEAKEALKMAYGYYESPLVKYVKYLRNMFTFGLVYPYFGWSTIHKEFVAVGLYWRLAITVFLLGTALVSSIILGIAIGTFAASKRGTKKDVGIMGSALLTWGMPLFFVQLLAISFFTQILYANYGIKVFATTWSGPRIPVKNLEWWAGAFSRLTLPILTLVLVGFGSWALYSRNMLVDALTKDFVVTARAKGLSERAILYKHTFKSILPPISTLITLSIPVVVTGSIITENIFGIEGIGRWFLMTFYSPDYGLIYVLDHAAASAIFFIYATLVVLLNLIVDLIYGVVDPRIRVGTRK